MEVVNEVLGTPDRFNAVLALDIEGSVSILHLLKFRETAAYEDGRGRLSALDGQLLMLLGGSPTA